MSDDEDNQNKESDFDRFLRAGPEDDVKPIDHDAPPADAKPVVPPAEKPKSDGPAADAPKKDAFLDKVAEYKAKAAAPRDRAASEENLDPVKQQQARELKAEEERKEKLRALDVPEHMMEHVTEDVVANLVRKGESVDLLQKVPSLRKLHVGAGWLVKALDEEVDVDLSVFLLDKNDVTAKDDDFVFYNHMMACDGAVKHEGDNRTGSGEGDEESIFIDLNGIPYEIVKIMIVLSVYDELEVGYHLGQVRNMYLRLANREYNEEICRFVLPEEYNNNTGIYVAALVREGPRWIFETLGTGIGRGGLPNIATRYGIMVKELQSSG